IDAGVAEKFISHPVHDAFVYVFTAEEGVARSGKNFEDAIAHFENGDIKSAAAEIVNSNAFNVSLAQAVSERGRGRLVDDSFHGEAGDFASVFRRLALRVVK